MIHGSEKPGTSCAAFDFLGDTVSHKGQGTGLSSVPPDMGMWGSRASGGWGEHFVGLYCVMKITPDWK